MKQERLVEEAQGRSAVSEREGIAVKAQCTAKGRKGTWHKGMSRRKVPAKGRAGRGSSEDEQGRKGKGVGLHGWVVMGCWKMGCMAGWACVVGLCDVVRASMAWQVLEAQTCRNKTTAGGQRLKQSFVAQLASAYGC